MRGVGAVEGTGVVRGVVLVHPWAILATDEGWMDEAGTWGCGLRPRGMGSKGGARWIGKWQSGEEAEWRGGLLTLPLDHFAAQPLCHLTTSELFGGGGAK